ncbi:MAG: universal stress protein [Pseudomonadota bacterium]
MFTHLLLPTDGSTRSEAAIQKGIQLAKITNGKVTGLHVAPKFHVLTYRIEMLEDTKEQFAKDSRAHAEKYLGVITKLAKEAGVVCDTQFVTSDHPYEAIIQTAKENSCDAIVMASHGRSGVGAVLLGSQTQKVLTHCEIPVVVIR